MSSKKTESFLWVNDLSKDEIRQLLIRSLIIKKNLKNNNFKKTLADKQIALVFSESSTRTKMSFQMAAQRLGAQCLVIDNLSSSSMSKGETFYDTFWTLHSMRPDLFIIRCGSHEPLEEVSKESEIPVINAGFGGKSHPTQALLDVFTMQEHFGSVENLKVLFVGDIDHSRVASSGIDLLRSFGAKVKVCAPKNFYQNKIEGVENFENLNDAIKWCDVYMGLRVQFERHSGDQSKESIKKDFISQFSLNADGLKLLNKKSVIMHPGPVNWDVEFSSEVQDDSRLLMWQQKENGVYVRAALMEKILKVEI
jgi:aspartate carbamoyltransferase catalytic subunit